MKLKIYSLEGGLYTVEIDAPKEHLSSLSNFLKSNGIEYRNSMIFKSLSEIKSHFQNIHVERVDLIHNNAYDEMIGLASGSEKTAQPIAW